MQEALGMIFHGSFTTAPVSVEFFDSIDTPTGAHDIARGVAGWVESTTVEMKLRERLGLAVFDRWLRQTRERQRLDIATARLALILPNSAQFLLSVLTRSVRFLIGCSPPANVIGVL